MKRIGNLSIFCLLLGVIFSCFHEDRVVYGSEVDEEAKVNTIQGLENEKHVEREIEISLATNWPWTSLIAETSENLADESPDYFWEFLEALDDTAYTPETLLTHQEEYELSLQAAKKVLGESSETQLSLLHWGLELRQKSVTVAAHHQTSVQAYQHAILSSSSSCKLSSDSIFWGLVGEYDPQLICLEDILNEDRLHQWITQAKKVEVPSHPSEDGGETQTSHVVMQGLPAPYEHMFPSQRNIHSPLVIVYLRMGAAQVATAVSLLKDRAQKEDIHLIVRHLAPAASLLRTVDENKLPLVEEEKKAEVCLQGYGVELHLKNMEYKAEDDKEHSEEALPQDDLKDSQEANEKKEEDLGTVAGFDLKRLDERRPDLHAELVMFQDYVKASAQADADVVRAFEEMRPWQVKTLDLQMAQRVFSSKNPVRMLRELSHNFPSAASSVSRAELSQDFRRHVFKVRKQLRAGTNVFTVNGRNIDFARVTPFSLHRVLKEEMGKAASLLRLHIDSKDVRDLLRGTHALFSKETMTFSSGVQPEEALANSPIAAKSPARLNIESKSAVFLNNMLTDGSYREFAPLSSIGDPQIRRGDFRFVRHNLLNLMLVCDPSRLECLESIATAFMYLQRGFPMRIGFMLAPLSSSASQEEVTLEVNEKGEKVALSEACVLLATAARVLEQRQGPMYAAYVFSSLVEQIDQPVISAEMAKALLVPLIGGPLYQKGARGSAIRRLLEARDVVDRLQLPLHEKQSALAFMNGVPLSSIQDTYRLVQVASLQYEEIEEMVAAGLLDAAQAEKDPNAVYHALLTRKARQLPRFSQVALHTPVEYFGLNQRHPQAVLDQVKYLSAPDSVDALKLYSLVVAGNFAPSDSKECVANAEIALEAIRWCEQEQDAARVAFLHVGEERDAIQPPILRAIQAGILSQLSSRAFRLATYLLTSFIELKGAWPEADLLAAVSTFLEVESRVSKFTQVYRGLSQLMKDHDHRVFFSRAELGISSEECALILNGGVRRIPLPLNSDSENGKARATIKVDDFVALQRIHAEHAEPMRGAFDRIRFTGVAIDDQTADFRSQVASKLISSLAQEEALGIVKSDLSQVPVFWESKEDPLVKQGADGDGVQHMLEVHLVIDPASDQTPRVMPLLERLMDHFPSAWIKLSLNPVSELKERPLKFFYRQAVQGLSFDEETGQLIPPKVNFLRTPPSRLMTLNLVAPPNWVVTASTARYDLDNIRLSDMAASDRVLRAEFRLDNLLIHGSCVDAVTREYPQGLQLYLGTGQEEHIQDTLVMKNIGYFQLKANPGLYTVRTAPGRARYIYQMVSERDAGKEEGTVASVSSSSSRKGGLVPNEEEEAGISFAVMSFEDEMHQLLVRRREGRERLALLEEDGGAEEEEEGKKPEDEEGFFGDAFGGDWLQAHEEERKQKEESSALLPPAEKLHVFSVASGHLYERFLKIMVLSVMKNTQTPVKFWFLKNFLSPEFKEFIYYMAEQVGFEVELVTYQWPHWLHPQTEKQRIIWAYKILFLDVLFPLDVEKIVFVDADQIVRTDLQDLFRINLQGAPYGYTPMCNSRKEMEGFRFWNRGFWQTHLQGRPYHISALYVVDLKQMRKMATGDVLRVSYHRLSQDPNSLANLDQDLPNFLQHQVPIYSLPQEWLWCETWCSEESKGDAKTIDLCNNPLTKTPKLENAVRIVSEWTTLDNEARKITDEFRSARESPVKHGDATLSSSSHDHHHDEL